MRLLLDTHAVIWWFVGDMRLPAIVRGAIVAESNDVFVSAASAWEITTKFRLGKLPSVAALAADLVGAISGQGFSALAVTVRHGQAAGSLPGPNQDPFDRMLIAQAMLDDLVLVSNETIFDRYGVARMW
ncbi:MAG: type II toxin-antitoxin system VapC family toxin [Acetobacteraceae bacterium]|nr:type II toxin-antitoxin system VapC family toxin [Acetobacteraceae bacterium]